LVCVSILKNNHITNSDYSTVQPDGSHVGMVRWAVLMQHKYATVAMTVVILVMKVHHTPDVNRFRQHCVLVLVSCIMF